MNTYLEYYRCESCEFDCCDQCQNEKSEYFGESATPLNRCIHYEEKPHIYEAKKAEFIEVNPVAKIIDLDCLRANAKKRLYFPNEFCYIGGQFWEMTRPIREQVIYGKG